MRRLLGPCLVAALACSHAGCAQIVLGVWLGTSGGSSGGGSGGGGGPPPPSGGGGTAGFSVAIIPAQGPAGGGTLARLDTLTPTVAFTAPPQVLIGGALATDVRVIDERTLELRTPANPQGNRSGPATVEVRLGGFLSTNASYQWQATAPTATGLSPDRGTTAGGTVVTITGSGFVAGMRVDWNGTAGSGVTVVGPSQLTAFSPPAGPGQATVVVTHPEGLNAVVPGVFTYEAGPPQAGPPSPPVAELTFAIVSGTGRAIHEVAITAGALSAPRKLGDLPPASAPQGLVAASADGLITIDRAGQQLLRFSRLLGQVTGTQALDANQNAERRGFARLFRKGDLQAVMAGMSLRDVNPTQGQTFPFGTLNGAARVEALAFSPWDEVFLAGSPGDDDASERLYTMGDSEVGNLIDIGPFGTDIDALTWGSDGRLYGLRAPVGATAQLYRIDPRTAAATLVGDTGVVGASGLCEVPAYVRGGGPGVPWIRATVPDVVVSGALTHIVVMGDELGTSGVVCETAGAAIQSVSTGGAGVGLTWIRLYVPPGFSGSEVVLAAPNAAGTTRFRLRVINGASALTVAAGQVLRLAGAIRVPQLTIAAGGRLQGTGLQPLLLFSDGPVQIDGTLDASGRIGGRPRRAMGTGNNDPSSSPNVFVCGDGGDAGPGGGGGGGGGPAERANTTRGGDGGWGVTGGGGGGGSPGRPSGRGGIGDRAFGGAPATSPTVFSAGGAGGGFSGSGGLGGFGGGGGGSGDLLSGAGGAGGPTAGQAAQTGRGGGAGGQHSSGGSGGGGGSYGTQGENGRLSDSGMSAGGGPAGNAHGSFIQLAGGSGGGGGSGRGAFNGLAQGGSGGGGAVVIASRASIAIGPTGVVLVNGGDGARLQYADGEGGAGSGGSLWLQAPEVGRATGARLEARGGARAEGSGAHGFRGAGGDGRVRADAPTLRVDGALATDPAFGAGTTPAAGFFGAAVPTVTITTLPGPSSGIVTLPYTATDADGNPVWIDVEYSRNGGPFLAARARITPDFTTFGVATSPAGVPHSFGWDSAADLGAGTFSVVLRIRAVDARVGPFATTPAFTVTN